MTTICTTRTMKFKGSRNYLHGTDIYQDLVAAIGSPVITMTIRRPLTTQPRLVLVAGEGRPDPQAYVQFTALDTASMKWHGWLEPTDIPVTDRYPYDESWIEYTHPDFHCLVANPHEGFTPIELVVSGNRILHSLRYPRHRFVMTKLEVWKELKDDRVTLVMNRGLANRRTVSTIIIGGEEYGLVTFTDVKKEGVWK